MRIAEIDGILAESSHEALFFGVGLDVVAVVGADDLDLVHAVGTFGPSEAIFDVCAGRDEGKERQNSEVLKS